MNKKVKKLNIYLISFFVITVGLYAAGGDLIVDGKIGIGLTAPLEKMDIKGKLRITHTNETDYGLIFMDDVDKSLYINCGNTPYNSIRFGVPSDYVGYIPKFQVMPGDWRTVIFTYAFQTKLSILSGDVSLGYGSAKVSIGTNNAFSRLDVNGSVKVANDTDAASANKVGSLRYRVSGSTSYCEMCMQTGASTYSWVVVRSNSW